MSISALGEWLYKNRYKAFFAAIGVIYIFNLFIDVMEQDAAQYAAIAMEMLGNGSYLEVYMRGADYLDKPPLLFWLAAFSFKIFGISTVSYKIPALLVVILGIFSTYRFTMLWYDKKRATLAALVLASTQAFMLITNDVRTDGILTGFVIFSVWQLSAFLQQGKFRHIFLGSLGVALAMMSKGPIGLIIPGLAIGSHILLNRLWKDILHWQWLAMLVFVAVCLIPMSYGLYTQFDLHPEKSVYGLDGPSGLRFFYWTQSFGRITGELYWDNGAPVTFFMHSILWDFQPWVLFLILAIIDRFKNIFVNKLKSPNGKEQLSFGGFVLVFLALSTSNFKLPHYIFPIFPFAAIFVADYMVSVYEKQNKYTAWFANIQFGILHIFFAMILISLVWFFPPKSFFLPIVIVLLAGLYYLSRFKISDKLERLITVTIIANVMVNLVMATNFYPQLLTYQSNGSVGRMVKEQNIPEGGIFTYKGFGHALDFYAQRLIKETKLNRLKSHEKGTLILSRKEGMEDIMKNRTDYVIIDSFPDYAVTILRPQFLNRKTRHEQLKTKYLMQKQ